VTTTLVTSVHLFVCILLIVLVLLQQGKGADVGATFGGGGNTMFGAGGADNFLTKFTTIIAVCFMLTSVFLGLDVRDSAKSSGTIFKDIGEPVPITEPSAPNAEELQKEISTEIEKAKAAKQAAADAVSESLPQEVSQVDLQPQESAPAAAPEAADTKPTEEKKPE
jgi:preprotein translocase subunit SecG